ncbi:hypothetical protein Taro_021289 [Colocasia esculenta]|uniref:Uncharacterized protein n=1 Tax=Colocasia esculenta TaxID=4460 RepID=A0A843V0Y0_COLES|nr:hypothetical protein [Colocasia esculenta]
MVDLSSGDYMRSFGYLEGVVVEVEGHQLPARLYALQLSDFDVILGVDWLEAHSAVVDFQRKTVRLGPLGPLAPSSGSRQAPLPRHGHARAACRNGFGDAPTPSATSVSQQGWTSRPSRIALGCRDCVLTRRDRCPVCQNGRVGWQQHTALMRPVRPSRRGLGLSGAWRRRSFLREGPNGVVLRVDVGETSQQRQGARWAEGTGR